MDVTGKFSSSYTVKEERLAGVLTVVGLLLGTITCVIVYVAYRNGVSYEMVLFAIVTMAVMIVVVMGVIAYRLSQK